MENPGTILLNEADVDRVLDRMALEILEKHGGGQDLALVGILTRGVPLARRVQKKILRFGKLHVPLGSVDINLYRDDWTRIAHQPVLQATDIPFSLDGKNVVLVDDVLFTGRTVRAAMDALIDFGRPDRIELAVLVDRGHRELPIQANYVGKYLETRHAERVNVFLAENDSTDQVVLE